MLCSLEPSGACTRVPPSPSAPPELVHVDSRVELVIAVDIARRLGSVCPSIAVKLSLTRQLGGQQAFTWRNSLLSPEPANHANSVLGGLAGAGRYFACSVDLG